MSIQEIPDDHARLRRSVRAVVDRAEGHLRAGAGIHGVQVVHQGFHGLIGGTAGLLHGVLLGEVEDFVGGGFIGAVGQLFPQATLESGEMLLEGKGLSCPSGIFCRAVF